MPGDAITLKNISHMPMANKHVPHAEAMQQIQFA